MWAAAYGQAPTVSLLLRHGAEINAHGQEQETALHLAAARGHHDVARILIASGAVVDAKDENR
jgi:ankyrin repeat protein